MTESVAVTGAIVAPVLFLLIAVISGLDGMRRAVAAGRRVPFRAVLLWLLVSAVGSAGIAALFLARAV
tara:strand:- start:307 stop:510 length:204 start_codon:yes stop_codon:yes gene_type:complete